MTNDPEAYKKYYHLNPVSGYILHEGKGKPVPKEYLLVKQITSPIYELELWNKVETKFILLQEILLIQKLQTLHY